MRQKIADFFKTVFGAVIFFCLLMPMTLVGFFSGVAWRCIQTGYELGQNFRFPDYRKRKPEKFFEPKIDDDLWNEFLKGWRRHGPEGFTPSGRGDRETGRMVTFAEMLQGKSPFEARALGEAEGKEFKKVSAGMDFSELIRQAQEMVDSDGDDNGPKGA